ncbi:MAG: S8 family peptidase [Candidatus Schekmanbacteria bacterium]|nr:S8 family peptidase [Candidatus Schekmanbacteria bacterium]
MSDKDSTKLPHLILKNTAITEQYTSRTTGSDIFKLPNRKRKEHGTFLKNRLELIIEEQQLKIEKKAFGIDAGNGIYLQFESESNFPLKIDSLEYLRNGIELCATKEIEGKTYAVVFVPEGKLAYFVKRVDKYLNENRKNTDHPKNQNLIDSISDIHRAALKALWMDKEEDFPSEDQDIWWEVWLRGKSDKQKKLDYFKEYAEKIGIRVGNEHIAFPERLIILAYGNREQMSKSIDLLNCIAELRKAKETADFFMNISSYDQAKWVEEVLSRIKLPPNNAPAVCILDTGINNGHPLIKPALNLVDMHSYHSNWNVADHHGHGTEMAGLAIYGDLLSVLLSNEPIQLTHLLESVKILPPSGQNDPKLYGCVTAESVARAEIAAPERNRTLCMAVATEDFRDRGKPSSWSAAVDSLCSGADDNNQRLFIISAGNTNENMCIHYPNYNMLDEIHDPGQSWNALTVGAYTEKSNIDQSLYPNFIPVAQAGDLNPISCTSMTWEKQWPIKPEIVLEGGNKAINHTTKIVENPDSLRLLSTYYLPLVKQFSTTGETSAATALASRIAATIQAYYPKLWPETIRALLIHSAKWTEPMKARFNSSTRRNDAENLLRYCGYGVPDLKEALWSARNSLTLIVQDALQPFDKQDNFYKTRDMHLHRIPWPKEILQSLGSTKVDMRVTLSYYIEPNPGSRGWKGRYRYASHQLRFDVKTASENETQFRKRINKASRDEEEGKTSDSDIKDWQLGSVRNRGSIHSDWWSGTAADLASRGLIAVYPIIGWWRERHQLGKWNKKARYALVITIKTPETSMDIYTEVANKLEIPIQISI